MNRHHDTPADAHRSQRPYRSVASRMTPAHHVAVREAADAELRGDAALALRRHRSVPMFAESRHGDRLQLIAELGDQTPGWLVSRWLAEQSRRPFWDGSSSRRSDQAMPIVLPVIYPDGVDLDTVGCDHVEQVTPFLHARDWVVRQVDVYELGHLREVVEHHATPELVARADHVAEWCDAPMGGYRLDGAGGPGVVRLTDLATHLPVDVLDLGLTELLDVGQHLIGRVVPVDVGPGLMFESRPLPIEPGTAVAVARSPMRWMLVLRMKMMAGRIAAGFSYLPDTSISADLPTQSWLTLIGRTPSPDGRFDPALAAVALDEALRLAASEPKALTGRRHRISELLLDVDLIDQVRMSRTGPEHLVAWQRLAATLDGPARERCLTMVMWCDAVA